MKILYQSNLKSVARMLRSNQTKSEKILWSYIKKKKICQVQFYRQKIIGQFIVDFYCPVANLIIEIDGKQHSLPENKSQDQCRDNYLLQLGLNVMRFTNHEIMNNLDEVLKKISIYIELLAS